MSGREGGKKKPLKAAKKDPKEFDEVSLKFLLKYVMRNIYFIESMIKLNNKNAENSKKH
jgi:hypothetical protein